MQWFMEMSVFSEVRLGKGLVHPHNGGRLCELLLYCLFIHPYIPQIVLYKTCALFQLCIFKNQTFPFS